MFQHRRAFCFLYLRRCGRLSTSLRGMYSRWMVYLTCWRPSHSQWLTALAKLPELEYPSRRAHIAAVPDATRFPVLASQTVYHMTLWM